MKRRILLDLAVTLDGFIEGKNGEVDWCITDSDMGFIDFLNQIKDKNQPYCTFIFVLL